MLINRCYFRPMTSTEGLIASLVETKESLGELTIEQATFLVTSLYLSIESLVSGEGDLKNLSIASRLLQEFGRNTVEGAITPVPTQDLDEQIAFRNEVYGSDTVLAATALKEECEDAWSWNLELRGAFAVLARRPAIEQTAESLRELFLQRVDSRNQHFATHYPKRKPLVIEDLRAALDDLRQ